MTSTRTASPCMGFSMGSFITSLTGAVDPRIHSVLLVGGGDLDGPNGYWDLSHVMMCQGGPYRSLAFLGDRPAVLFTLKRVAATPSSSMAPPTPSSTSRTTAPISSPISASASSP